MTKKPKPAKKKFNRKERLFELVRDSSLSIHFSAEKLPLQHARISIYGPCSKLPSISNQRLVKGIIDKTGKARGVSAPNPEREVILEALTVLYNRRIQALRVRPSFMDSPKNRLFGVMLLGDECLRMDSHNIPKAACDWLQEIGLVKNDANLDVMPVHKSRFGELFSGMCTTILITRFSAVKGDMETLLRKLYAL